MISGLESANLKLIRAAEHIDTVEGLTLDYTESEPDAVIPQPDGSHDFKFVTSPPDQISVVAGEAIYQIRSALDHLAFQLIESNPTGISLPTGWEEKCAFPLRIRTPKKPPIFNCFEDTLPGLTVPAFTYIESLQPYNRGEINAELDRLVRLSNIDKHRHLHHAKPHAFRRDEVTVLYHGRRIINTHVQRVDDGAKTHSPFRGMEDLIEEVHVGGAFMPYVAFDEPSLDPGVKTYPISDLLQAILEKVQNFIVPAFSQFLK